MEHVVGFGIYNDGSVREYQRKPAIYPGRTLLTQAGLARG